MSEPQSHSLLSALADKVALELAFAQAGSDNGLLPINSFVIEMEEACPQGHPLKDAIAIGREIVDAIFAEAAAFTKESLATLSAWVAWLQEFASSGRVSKPFQFQKPEAKATTVTEPSQSEEAEDKPLILDLANDRELLQEFINESREHLQNIESGSLILEDNPSDAETLNSIFRAFHTFKGGSGFLKLTPMNKLAHELESLLDLARQSKIQITSEVIEVILNGGDTLKKFTDLIGAQLLGHAPEGPIFVPTGSLRARIAEAIARPARKAADGSETQTAFLKRSEDAVDVAANATNVSATTIKVDTAKLDSLVDMVGEMVIAQSLVAQDTDLKGLSNARLARNIGQLARVTKELQRAAMSLRMVPIRATFRKMTRLVRDLSVRAGKEVELSLAGEETELDRNIVEELSDPLIHMIRNSVDHGIELPDSRVTAGKNRVGRITLAAYHEGGNFVVQIRDDGAGLNRERILQKAVSQGLVAPGEELSEKEIFALIFRPGFSTAEKVTDVSGRGVGMDVVQQNIQKLRGRIDIESQPGQGTTISMHLPLTLAIIDGLIVRVGDERYILPTLSVRESFRPTADMLSKVHGRGRIVSVRGRLVPLLRLREVFSGMADSTEATDAVVLALEADGAQRCVLVDELIGKQEVVIKSLGAAFQDNPLLAGAAILGDGRVGLILDVKNLVQPRSVSLANAA